jgi:hypothetical protein
VGDWFLFKYFTLIRIYGFEDQPYQFPIYISPRLFSLEFCKQRLITDHFHFISKSKKDYFSLPAEFSSFLIKNKSTLDFIEKLLDSYYLKKDVSWKYDPYHII